MTFKYVPVLRYRSQERKALNSISISEKMLPLIEIITEKPTSNSRLDSIDQLLNDIENTNAVMVDIPLYVKMRNRTTKSMRDFLTPVLADIATRLNILTDKRLVASEKIIPVISYNPNVPYVSNYLTEQHNELRKYYKQIAYRVYSTHFNEAILELSNMVNAEDIIMLDIDEKSHKLPAYSILYKQVQQLSSKNNCYNVLIRSAIPRTVSNVKLNHGKIVLEADNSLLSDYSNFGFSAFGDYCGVRKDELTDGGIISPGYIMYSWDDNSYYGFKGVKEMAETFESIVAPSIISSSVYRKLSLNHSNGCHGCSNIVNIHKKTKKGKSQPEWKGFACGHYLYTMEEFL